MKKFHTILVFVFLLLGFSGTATAQPVLQNNYSFSMEVPSVVAMESSQAHLYILSQSEGMAVFRTRTDSLQWLYTAGGMQQRGNTIQADIRFAYLFGDSRRLTVLEPTSVLGAYSSTNLPFQPLDAERLDENLYVLLGSGNLGKLDLSTPESLDSEVEEIESPQLNEKNIVDITASPNRLFVLSDDSELFIFNKMESGISLDQSISPNQTITRVFYVNDALMGTNNEGTIFEINTDGNLNRLGTIEESVTELKSWDDWLIIRGSSNRLWTSYQSREPTLWKENRDAGNYLAISKGQLWISEYNRISRVSEVSRQAAVQTNGSTDNTTSSPLEIQSIPDQVIPYPNSLLIPLQINGNYPVGDVQFSVQTGVQNAVVRGQSLYWKPQSGDTGQHQFKIIATSDGQTSTTTFTVDVRSFNAPPRFTPLRTISIPLGRPFSLPIKAIDPDATNKNLVRYLGVNLPNNSTIDEQTGDFNWTPTDRQVGENSFRVIATDQYGAASSQNVTIRVIETNSGN